MANYPQELAQDAVCQSHTGHMTGLWFLPTRPLRLNTNERMSKYYCSPKSGKVSRLNPAAMMGEKRSFGEENVIEWDQFEHLPVMAL